jgi:hypothetical protein
MRENFLDNSKPDIRFSASDTPRTSEDLEREEVKNRAGSLLKTIEGFGSKFFRTAQSEISSARSEVGEAWEKNAASLFRELASGIKKDGLFTHWKDMSPLQRRKLIVYSFWSAMAGSGLLEVDTAEAEEIEEAEFILEEAEEDHVDEDKRHIELRIGFTRRGTEQIEDGLPRIANMDDYHLDVSVYEDYARRIEGFKQSAQKYLNTQNDARFANGLPTDPDKDYYFVPIGEIDGFIDEIYLNTDGTVNFNYQSLIDKELKPRLSEDGHYYIFPKDISEYGNFRDLSRLFFLFAKHEELDIDEDVVKEDIFVDADRATGYGLSIPEMQDVIYNTLETIKSIELFEDDIKDSSLYDSRKGRFDVDDERRADIEEQFIESFRDATKEFSEDQKLASLALMGDIFSINYDDQIKKDGLGGQGKIPLSEFLLSARALQGFNKAIPTGVCRHINQKLPEIAERVFGMRGITKGTYKSEMHAIGGVRLEDGTIAFFDYGTVIRTGTPDIKKASSFYEQYVGRIEGESFIGNAKGDLKTIIKSRATESREEAIHYKSGEEKIEKLLENGRIIETTEGLIITAENEKQEIAVNQNHLVASVVHLDKSADPYNALDKLYGIRVGAKSEGEHKSFHISASFLAERLKRLKGGTSSSMEMAQELGWDIARRFDLSEDVSIAIANTLNGFLVANLDHMNVSSVGAGDSFGARFSYISPDKPFELHIGAKNHIIGSIGNIQTGGFDRDGIGFHRKLSEIDVATRIPVSEKLTVGVSGVEKFGDMYHGRQVGGSITSDSTGARVLFEKQRSKDLLFLPHNKSGEIELTSKTELAGRQSIVTLFGSRSESDYGKKKEPENRFTAGITILF